MKIIFRGGYNVTSYNSIKNSILFEHGSVLCRELEEGKKVVVITAGKPDDNYYQMLHPLIHRGALEINQSFSDSVDWGQYDWMIVMGGINAFLMKKLQELDFSFDKLKSSAVYVGDSAGAMIHAAFYYVYDRVNNNVTFHKGLLPDEKRIFIVHADNTYYVDDLLRKEVKKFAEQENLEIIEIKENEEINI